MSEQPTKYDFPLAITYASVFLTSLITGVALFGVAATLTA